MNVPISCKTCRKYNKCMEALRFYPCKDYERRKENAKSNINKNPKAE